LDEAEVKPYFTLDGMVKALFHCAYKLFKLRFHHRPDIVTYHPDVQTYVVYEETESASGEKSETFVGIFLHGALFTHCSYFFKK
jgi:peptidyl-dipeptidase Dcp